MGMAFDNRISWMDIVVVVGAALGIYFGAITNAQTNAQNIKFLQTTVLRIETNHAKHESEVLIALEHQEKEIKEYRNEAQESTKLVMDKLDSLILRELSDLKSVLREK